jgi:hypothetical protein
MDESTRIFAPSVSTLAVYDHPPTLTPSAVTVALPLGAVKEAGLGLNHGFPPGISWAVTLMSPESSEHVHLKDSPSLIGPSVTAPVTTSTDGMLGIEDLL